MIEPLLEDPAVSLVSAASGTTSATEVVAQGKRRSMTHGMCASVKHW